MNAPLRNPFIALASRYRFVVLLSNIGANIFLHGRDNTLS